MLIGGNLRFRQRYLDGTPTLNDLRLVQLEWFFLPLLRHYRHPRTLHRMLAARPEFFHQLMQSIYPIRDDDSPAPSVEEQNRARAAYEVLDAWRQLPGLQSDGTITADELRAWVESARRLGTESGRPPLWDQQIGRVLAVALKGEDNVWPHESVRDLVEDLASENIEVGIALGIANDRGWTIRSLGAGGAQERVLVKQYREYAPALREAWPRTARLVERIAESFEHDAHRNDIHAELEQDLWR